MNMEQKIDKAAREYRTKKTLAVGVADNQSFLCPFKMFEDAFKAGAAYALSNQWHSAKEELPEIGKDVLIAYFSNNAENYFDIASKSEFGEWYSATSEHGYPIDTPTHWMPVPALPQERKETGI